MSTAIGTTDNSPSLPIIDYSKLVEVKTSDDPGHSLTRRNEQHKLFAALRDVGFEAFDIGDDNDPTQPNQWPSNWPDFRTDMASFFEHCHQVHLELLSALAEQVGLEPDFFLPASPHTDYCTLTLLFNDLHGGLQVRNKAGDYVDAPPLPGAAIVNVGDLLSRWFNDTLKSTEHRVVEPSAFDKSGADIPDIIPARYSIAWFGHPNRDALIESIESCCTSDNPKKYEPVYARKHVVERLAKLHKDGKNTETWTDSMGSDGKQDLVSEVKVGA
ncbi:MAG: hypothetical protein Q9171_005413 [Xanthocarpia ochracea]